MKSATQPFNSLIERWLNKRIPAAPVFSLHHKNIFIFPSKFGFLYLFLCLLMFLLGTNYQNNLMLLLCYFLLAVFLVNLINSYSNFARLSVKIGKVSDTYTNENAQLLLWFEAAPSHSLSVHGVVNIGFRKSSRQQQFDFDNPANPVALSLKCTERGMHAIPRMTLSSNYPLGLIKCWTHLAFSPPIYVIPAPIFSPLDLLSDNPINNAGDAVSENKIDASTQDDFSHLKNYQVGEPLRHVAWKQLAKGRGMLSKQFSGTQQHTIWLVLPHSSNTKQLEESLAKLSFQITALSQKERTFGLKLHHQVIEPNTGDEHRQSCLRALALFPPISASKMK